MSVHCATGSVFNDCSQYDRNASDMIELIEDRSKKSIFYTLIIQSSRMFPMPKLVFGDEFVLQLGEEICKGMTCAGRAECSRVSRAACR